MMLQMIDVSTLGYEDIKKQVKALRVFLKEKDTSVCLGHCYEAVSKMYGYANWDTFSAILKKNSELFGISK